MTRSWSERAARGVVALVVGALLALAPDALAEAASQPIDRPDAAIARVREALRARGRPSGGPMVAGLVRPDAPEEGGWAWLVVADDAVWLVWGGVSGPLGPTEVELFLRSCFCEFSLPAPPRTSSDRAGTKSI